MTRRTAVIVVFLALGFAWFIWPTPYRTFGRAGLMQVNRFTGAKCQIGESCWRTPLPTEGTAPARALGTRDSAGGSARSGKDVNPFEEYVKSRDSQKSSGK
jgi:hypothetical protein